MKLLANLLAVLLGVATVFSIALASAGANDDESRRKQDWQQRYAAVLSRKLDAQQRIQVGRSAVRKARQRDRFKGEPRKKILAELESAERELATVLILLNDFPETARQAGVPPGWLREVDARHGG